MSKRLIKRTETLEVWKLSGTNSSDTITLSTDMLSPTMIISGTPTVNIIFVTWDVSSGTSDNVTVTRGGNNIFNLYLNGQLELNGNLGQPETTSNTDDINVSITGTGNCYLTLRKASGYASKIETAQFSVYDNTSIVGA